MSERRWFDSGSLAGGFAAALVLVLWLSGAQRGEVSSGMVPLLGEDKIVEAIMEGTSLPAEEMGVAGELEAKALAAPPKPWVSAVSLGKSGVEQAIEAYKRHEVRGDPFRLRSELKKARKKVEGSIKALDHLLLLDSLSSNERQTVKKWQDYFFSEGKKLFPIK